MFEGKSKATIRRIIIAEQNGACNHCGITEWRGKPITLELEHRDGNSQNDVRGNLECICPNCHSQTDTWRGRNKTKKVSDHDMIAMLKTTRSMHRTLLNFGMAAKGGNYRRVKRLVAENGIELLKTTKKSASQLLSPDAVRTIREARKNGQTLDAIARAHGVSRGTIASVVNGRTYQDVA